MISVTPARRRAEEFAALVDGDGGAEGTRREDLLELVGVVSALRSTPVVAARATYVDELRAALMLEADVALAQVDQRLTLPTHARKRTRDRRFAIAAGTVALLGAGSSMAVAAQDALPGDALYPIKRVMEGARTTLTVDEISKGERLLANASGRLDEVSALQARNTLAGNAAMADTLDDFSDQADDAADVMLDEFAQTGDQAAIEELRDFTATSMDTLVALGDDVPAEARSALDNAARTLKGIDERAAAACPLCGGGIEEVPPMFQRALADQIAPSSATTAAPVVIQPLAPQKSAGSTSSGSKSGSGNAAGGGTEAPTLPSTDGGTDGGTDAGDESISDVTKKVLGSGGTASAPKDPVKELEEKVVDPLLGDSGLLP